MEYLYKIDSNAITFTLDDIILVSPYLNEIFTRDDFATAAEDYAIKTNKNNEVKYGWIYEEEE